MKIWYDIEREPQLKLAKFFDIKRPSEDSFLVSFDLGFKCFEGKGNTLRNAIEELTNEIDYFSWKDFGELTRLSRKMESTNGTFLNIWCSDVEHMDVEMLLTFEKKGCKLKIRLSGSEGMADTMYAYQNGYKLDSVGRYWEQGDVRMGVEYYPERKFLIRQYSMLITAEDHNIILACYGKDPTGCVQEMREDLFDLVTVKAGEMLPITPNNKEEMHV